MALPHDPVRRLRALIARGMASPQDELNLRLLLLSLYGRPGRMVELEEQKRLAKEDGAGGNLSSDFGESGSLPEEGDEEAGLSRDK